MVEADLIIIYVDKDGQLLLESTPIGELYYIGVVGEYEGNKEDLTPLTDEINLDYYKTHKRKD